MERNNSKGFTVVELMVTLIMILLIHSIVIGFYLFQSRKGGQAAKETSSRHGLALALMQLQRDVVQMGYGLSLYPQMACYLATQNPSYPSSSKPYYDTIYVSYGQFLKSGIPTTGTNSPYTMWPSLVYSFYATPMNFAANISGGQFSIPAPTQAEALANAINVGAIIFLNNPTSPTTPSPGLQLLYPINPSGAPSPPGTVPSPVPTGQTMSHPPSGWVTTFTLKGTPPNYSGPSPSGNYYFTPAVVYSFQPPQINPTTGLLSVPGQILRNGLPFLGGSAQAQSTSATTTSQESFFSIYDFQVRGLFIPPAGGTQPSGTNSSQMWAPAIPPNVKAAGYGQFSSLITTSNLRYVEIRIAYTIIQGEYSNTAAQTQAQALKTVTRLIRVNPRSVVLSQMP